MSCNTNRQPISSDTTLFIEQKYKEHFSGDDAGFELIANYAYYNIEELLNNIKTHFGDYTTYESRRYDYNKKDFSFDEKLLFFKNCMIFLKNKTYSGYGPKYIEEDEQMEPEEALGDKIRIVLWAEEPNEKLQVQFKQIVSTKAEQERKKREISILCFNQMEGFYLKNVKTLNSNVDIDNNYNDDFKEVSEYIINRLNNKNDKGVLLLHGVPGTGKTSYIRHLTKAIVDKQIVYIPPDFAVNIANPDFVSFFLDYPNSILIIEDAENILRSREAGGNQSVSNLLSISDGLLGDGLKLQILCTFNCDLNQIDTALLREGRLIAEYKFDKLKMDKAKSLAQVIFPDDKEVADLINEDKTLAQIYNLKEKRFVTQKPKGNIGFNRK